MESVLARRGPIHGAFLVGISLRQGREADRCPRGATGVSGASGGRATVVSRVSSVSSQLYSCRRARTCVALARFVSRSVGLRFAHVMIVLRHVTRVTRVGANVRTRGFMRRGFPSSRTRPTPPRGFLTRMPVDELSRASFGTPSRRRRASPRAACARSRAPRARASSRRRPTRRCAAGRAACAHTNAPRPPRGAGAGWRH
eukprot:3065334-Prymnesium_polylepis.2